MSNLSIFKSMKRDLKVQKHPQELDHQYYSRLVYSGMSIWLKTSVLDKNLTCAESDHGVSKVHQLRRCSKVLTEFLDLYPDLRKWFFPELVEEPVDIIRERMLKSGELIDIGFKTNIAIPVYEEYRIGTNVMFCRGLKTEFLRGMSSGLAWLNYSDFDTDNRALSEIFPVELEEAQKYTESYIHNAFFENYTGLANMELFDPTATQPLSVCWSHQFKLNEGQATVGRINIGYKYEYYVLKKLSIKTLLHKIPSYFQEHMEVRRLLYGLRAKNKNPVYASIKRNRESGLIDLSLYSALPEIEESILLLLGWPKNHINDIYHLLFPDEVWPLINDVINSLNIEIKEG